MTYQCEPSRSRSFWSIHGEQAVQKKQKNFKYISEHTAFQLELPISSHVDWFTLVWVAIAFLSSTFSKLNFLEGICSFLTFSPSAANGMYNKNPSYLLFGPWLSNIWASYGSH